MGRIIPLDSRGDRAVALYVVYRVGVGAEKLGKGESCANRADAINRVCTAATNYTGPKRFLIATEPTRRSRG